MREFRGLQQLIFILVFSIVCGVGILILQNATGNKETATVEANDIDKKVIMVQVAGAIKNPGVYECALDTRVMDAIEKAGGTLEGADVTKLNLVAYVKDGQKISIPYKKSSATKSTASHTSTQGQSYIKIKGATDEINRQIADLYLQYGSSLTVSHLARIVGITESMIKDAAVKYNIKQ